MTRVGRCKSFSLSSPGKVQHDHGKPTNLKMYLPYDDFQIAMLVLGKVLDILQFQLVQG